MAWAEKRQANVRNAVKVGVALFLAEGPNRRDRLVASSVVARRLGRNEDYVRETLGLSVGELNELVLRELLDGKALTRTDGSIARQLEGIASAPSPDWESAVRNAASDVFRSALHSLRNPTQPFSGLRGRLTLWVMMRDLGMSDLLARRFEHDTAQVADACAAAAQALGLALENPRADELTDFAHVVSATLDGLLLRAVMAADEAPWVERFADAFVAQVRALLDT